MAPGAQVSEGGDRIKIGDCHAIPVSGLIIRNGTEISVNPRTMQVLQILIERQGQLVSTQELLDEVWPSNHVGGNTVYKAINELREAFGDSAHEHRYIETKSRKGYRLVAAVDNPVVSEAARTTLRAGISDYVGWLTAAAVLIATGINVWYANSGSLDGELVHFEDSQFVLIHANEISNPARQAEYDVLSQALLTKLATEYDALFVKADDTGVSDQGNSIGVLEFEEMTNELIVTFELDNTPMLFETFDWTVPLEAQTITSYLIPSIQILSSPAGRKALNESGTRNILAYRSFLEGQTAFKYRDAAHFRQTIRAMHTALDHDPNYVDAYKFLNWSYHHLYPISLDTIEQESIRQEWLAVIDKARHHVSEISEELEMLMSVTLSDHAAALNNIRRILANDPRHIDALIEFAELLVGMGFVDEARDYIEHTIELGEPEDSSVLISVSDSAGETEEYIRRAKKNLEKEPNHTITMFGLATRMAQIGRLDEAARYIQQLETADPAGAWAYTAKVTTDVLTGKLKQIDDDFRQQIEDPRIPKIAQGRIYFMVGDVENGVQAWQEIEPAMKFYLVQFLAAIESYYAGGVVSDPRYQALLEQFNLGATWRRMLLQSAHDLASVTGIAPHTPLASIDGFQIARIETEIRETAN